MQMYLFLFFELKFLLHFQDISYKALFQRIL